MRSKGGAEREILMDAEGEQAEWCWTAQRQGVLSPGRDGVKGLGALGKAVHVV